MLYQTRPMCVSLLKKYQIAFIFITVTIALIGSVYFVGRSHGKNAVELHTHIYKEHVSTKTVM